MTLPKRVVWRLSHCLLQVFPLGPFPCGPVFPGLPRVLRKCLRRDQDEAYAESWQAEGSWPPSGMQHLSLILSGFGRPIAQGDSGCKVIAGANDGLLEWSQYVHVTLFPPAEC
jgi:hypothetical protein